HLAGAELVGIFRESGVQLQNFAEISVLAVDVARNFLLHDRGDTVSFLNDVLLRVRRARRQKCEKGKKCQLHHGLSTIRPPKLTKFRARQRYSLRRDSRTRVKRETRTRNHSSRFCEGKIPSRIQEIVFRARVSTSINESEALV